MLIKKREIPLQYDLTPQQKAGLDAMIKKDGFEKAMMSLIDEPTPPIVTETFSQDKNSYAFWGPTTAELVKTPNSFYVPISYDAFKVSGMEMEFSSKELIPAYEELFVAASKILGWCMANNLNEFFLKNSNFSGKHRWPYTCDVNFSYMKDAEPKEKVYKILNHVHNINSYAMLHWSKPGLGLLARQKLDLEPVFYAFGTTFYNLINKNTGTSKIIKLDAAHKNVDKYMEQMQMENPDIMFEKLHVGMPITKELRIFSINGDIQGYVPYWTPVAFKNQSVYGFPEGANFDEVLRKMNTFTKPDLDYLHDETKKIITHPKFQDTNWAIDWVLTRDKQWYMIDMQTAESSHMDVENMIFANDNAPHIVYNFINSQYDRFRGIVQNMSVFNRMIAILTRTPLNIDKRMQRFGYPTQKRLNELRKQLVEKTI